MKVFSRILLTGGGTAGHVNPALAIGRALGDERTAYLYVGVRGRAEADVVPRDGMPITFVRASPYPGARPSAAWVPFLFNLVAGTLAAAVVIGRFRPEIIVGTGGFASAPAMFAAALLRRAGLCRAQVFVHEQNAAPGRLNLLVGRLADRVFVSFPETVAAFHGNAVVTGYPLRSRIAAIDRETARQALDFVVPPGRQVVLVFGGSQGARTLNRAIVDALGALRPHSDRLFIIHGTGLCRGDRLYDAQRDVQDRLREIYSAEEQRAIEACYVARPYFHEIEKVYAVADLAVVRAGAGTLNEIASLGLPAIVVPKINLPGEHQVMNARALARRGGAVVLYEHTRIDRGRRVEELDGAALASAILSLIGDPARLEAMGEASRGFIEHDALDLIRQAVESAAAGSPPAPQPREGDGRRQMLLSNQALLAVLERERSAVVGRQRPMEAGNWSADDRTFYVSRATSLLAHPSWEARNLGVKLLGLLQARDRLPLILALLADRTPAAWHKRLIGGDFAQVGFIRRNAIVAIARLGVVTPEVERALAEALADPYYEVRAEACRAVTRLDHSLSASGRTRLVTGLMRLLGDRWVEVVAAAAEALGHVGGPADARPALLALRDQKFWIVRAAGLRGLLALIERGQAGDLASLAIEVRGFALTATDFRPEFSIRSSYGRVVEAMAERRSTP